MKSFQTVRSIVETEPHPKEHSPRMPDFKLTLVVACALIDADKRVLIAQRPEGKTLAGLWEFPGGKLEPGERPEATLIRELHEEIGLDIGAARPLTELSFTFGRHGRIQRYFFEVPIGAAILPELRLREGADMRAFAASDILTRPRVVPYDSFAIWLHASNALL